MPDSLDFGVNETKIINFSCQNTLLSAWLERCDQERKPQVMITDTVLVTGGVGEN